MYDAMRLTLVEADAQELAAVIISGTGGHFTSGNDIADFLAFSGEMIDHPASQFILALAQCKTPLIAAVDGVAIGIGTTLLLHCDFVYATAQAIFRMPFTDLGLVPEAGASLLIPARFGHAKAAEWLLLGDGFTAEQALQAGLINAIVSSEALHAHTFEIARRLAAKPRTALRQTRALMRGDQTALLNQIHLELETFGAALKSDFTRARLNAFMTKKG
eukprot:gene13404-13518_t